MVDFVDPSASISGTRGWITLPTLFWTAPTYEVHLPDHASLASGRTVEFIREGLGYVPMLRAVGEAIRDGLTEHPLHTWEDSLRVFTILDEVRRQLLTTRGG